jgi:hypothetical protein
VNPDEVLRALAQAPACVCLIDRAGVLVWASAVGYGLDGAETVGHPADRNVVAADRPVWEDAFLRARDGREVVRYTLRLAVPEPPHVVRLAGRTAPVLSAGGRVTHVLAVTVDVTYAGGECAGCPGHAIRARELQQVAPPGAPDPLGTQLVTLDQCAAMVHRRKRSLEHYRRRMPAPRVTGRRGQPSLWEWADVRPWLEGHFGRVLPERFPG